MTLWGCASDVPVSGEPPWTFIVLPDTQTLSLLHPEIYEAQTQWIAAQRQALDIRFVLHVGDVVETNSEVEWQRARKAMAALDGVVPYAMVPGNHDYGDHGTGHERVTPMAQYFPPSLFEAGRTSVVFFEPDRVDNSAHVFETPEGPWFVLALEFGPRPKVLQWAHEQAAAHAGMPGILLTHAYLYSGGRMDVRYDIEAHPVDQSWSPYHYGLASGGVSDGQEIWEALVSRHRDLGMVICGHVLNDGVGRQISTRFDGSRVEEILANFQHFPWGGAGYLRIFEVYGDRIDVRTWSPWLKTWKRSGQHQFTMARDPDTLDRRLRSGRAQSL